MQMPRRAMQKQGSPRPRVAIDRLTGGFRSQSTISRSSRRRSTDPDKCSNVRLRNYRDREWTSGSFCRSIARDTRHGSSSIAASRGRAKFPTNQNPQSDAEYK